MKRTAKARSSVTRGSALWEPASTAPKGPLILADFGWPWPIMAAWSEMSGKWAAVSVQFTDTDTWFETETELPKDLLRWMPWPKLPMKEGEK